MPTTTTEQFTEAIEAAVAERGSDYVYPLHDDSQPNWNLNGVCVYAVETESGLKPGCIVGDVFDRLGVATLDRMHEFEVETQTNTNLDTDSTLGTDSTVGPLVEHLALDLPPRVLNALREAQTEQDYGNDWGTALDAYKRTLNRWTV